MTTKRRAVATAAVTLALALGSTACSDEDGDGATTDEELQDVEDRARDAGEELEEEVEGRDRGSNRDNE